MMGMFDTIYVHTPLPVGYEFLQDKDFQTKDLYCCMEEYHITSEGRLVLRKYEHEDVPKEEQTEHPIFGWMPSTRRTGRHEDRDVNFHGDFVFYDYVEKIMYDFVARFTHGTLEYIKYIDSRDELITRFEIATRRFEI